MSINLLSNPNVSKSLGLLSKSSISEGIITFLPNITGRTTWTSVGSSGEGYGWKAVYPFTELNNNLSANSVCIATVSAPIITTNIKQYSSYWIISSSILPIKTVGALKGGIAVVVAGTDATTPPPANYEIDYLIVY
jgi:hypothetical protein